MFRNDQSRLADMTEYAQTAVGFCLGQKREDLDSERKLMQRPMPLHRGGRGSGITRVIGIPRRTSRGSMGRDDWYAKPHHPWLLICGP